MARNGKTRNDTNQTTLVWIRVSFVWFRGSYTCSLKPIFIHSFSETPHQQVDEKGEIGHRAIHEITRNGRKKPFVSCGFVDPPTWQGDLKTAHYQTIQELGQATRKCFNKALRDLHVITVIYSQEH